MNWTPAFAGILHDGLAEIGRQLGDVVFFSDSRTALFQLQNTDQATVFAFQLASKNRDFESARQNISLQ